MVICNAGWFILIWVALCVQVFIAEPYKPDNCTSIHPDDTTTMDRVKKVVGLRIKFMMKRSEIRYAAVFRCIIRPLVKVWFSVPSPAACS